MAGVAPWRTQLLTTHGTRGRGRAERINSKTITGGRTRAGTNRVGTRRAGTTRDGTARDGTRDGTTRDGTARDGTTRDGTRVGTTTKNHDEVPTGPAEERVRYVTCGGYGEESTIPSEERLKYDVAEDAHERRHRIRNSTVGGRKSRGRRTCSSGDSKVPCNSLREKLIRTESNDDVCESKFTKCRKFEAVPRKIVGDGNENFCNPTYKKVCSDSGKTGKSDLETAFHDENEHFTFKQCRASPHHSAQALLLRVRLWRGLLWTVIVTHLFLIASCRTVRTRYGDVSGVIVTPDNRYLDAVEVFKGIPYASPPVGSLRFMPPVSGAMWQGVKMANRFSPVCPQKLPDVSDEAAALKRMPRGRLEYLRRMIPHLRNHSEDCLYLNVYVPHVVAGDAPPRFPVLVYIHGDSYLWGAGSLYDGTVLSSHGEVVVVTLNYRLGVLGFLNANSGPSNFALMDQIAALHWVQENIAAFGGDPRNVTVMGHGAGAVCVHLLATSTAVPEGALFQRVILLSGSALCPWALVQDPAKYTRQISRHTGCPWDRQLLQCLRQRPLEALLSVPADHPQFVTALGPSVDGVVVGGRTSEEDENYLPPALHQHNMLGQLRRPLVAKLSRYPLLLGTVRLESYFAFTADDVQYGVEPDRKARLMRSFVKNTYRYHQSEILATVVNEYTDWERPVQHPINIRDETMDALSDALVVAPVVQTADLHSSSRAAAYMYVFDYQTRLGDYPQKQGCVHGEELPYVFGAPLVSAMSHFPRNFTKSEVQLSEMTMDYFTNFIKTGNPNTGGDLDLPLGVRLERQRAKVTEWLPYDKVHKRYLHLDMKPKMKNHYRAHRLSFWLNLVPDLHRPGGDDVPHSHHLLEPGEHPKQAAPPPPPRPPPAPSDADAAPAPPPVVAAPAQGATRPRPQEVPAPTALRATIAVGGSLLILNIVVFFICFLRGRGEKNKKRARIGGSLSKIGGSLSKIGGSLEKIENGGPMSTICVTSGATDLSSVETRLSFTPVLGDSLTDLRSFTVPAPEQFQGPLTPDSPEATSEPPEVPSPPDVAPPLPPKTSKSRSPANESLPLLSPNHSVPDVSYVKGHGGVNEDVLRV